MNFLQYEKILFLAKVIAIFGIGKYIQLHCVRKLKLQMTRNFEF